MLTAGFHNNSPSNWTGILPVELLFLRGNAGGGAILGNLIHECVFSGFLKILFLIFLGGLSLGRCGLRQSADGEGDLMLVIIDSGDLGIDDIADRQNIFGLANTAVGDLGNVDQTINTGQNLGKRAKGISLTTLTEATSPTW